MKKIIASLILISLSVNISMAKSFYKEKSINDISITSPVTKLDTIGICDKIERTVDDLADRILINSPIIGDRGPTSMTIIKSIEASKQDYFLALNVYGGAAYVGKSGVIILFDDGTKIKNDSHKIEVKAAGSSYEYSVFMPLTETQVEKLATAKIKKFRLVIYDKEVNDEEAEKFMYYVRCILDKE